MTEHLIDITFPPGTPNLPSYHSILDYCSREWTSDSKEDWFKIIDVDAVKTAIDIGANIGIAPKVFFEKFPNLKSVHCFEPHPDNFNILEYNLGEDPRVTLHQCGIYYGVTEGYPKDVGDSNMGGYIFSEVPNDTFDRNNNFEFISYPNISWKMKTLEEFFEEPVDLIKIDVEGSEFNIIENSPIFRNSKYLFIEFHGKHSDYLCPWVEVALPHFKVIKFEPYFSPYAWQVFLENVS